MNNIQNNASGSKQTCAKAGLIVFILIALMALALMCGCRGEAADTGATEDSTGQSQPSESTDAVGSEGYVFEATAAVDVNIGEEGE